jgi:hypothetical protein
MLSQPWLWSQLLRIFGAIVLTLSAISTVHAQSATAPTDSQDPVSIDQTWQRSSSKYDAARAALLKEVDSADQQGPFRPDWESLQKYEVPNGTGTQNSGFSFIGASIPCQLSAMNGIHE